MIPRLVWNYDHDDDDDDADVGVGKAQRIIYDSHSNTVQLKRT